MITTNRMDEDTEFLHRECERLRGRVAQLENSLVAAQQECQRLRNRAEDQDENAALRIIIKHLVGLL